MREDARAISATIVPRYPKYIVANIIQTCNSEILNFNPDVPYTRREGGVKENLRSPEGGVSRKIGSPEGGATDFAEFLKRSQKMCHFLMGGGVCTTCPGDIRKGPQSPPGKVTSRQLFCVQVAIPTTAKSCYATALGETDK